MIDALVVAFYLGNAFCGAVNVQHVLVEGEQMVPIVIHWNKEMGTGLSYTGATQKEAVEAAIEAREKQPPEFTGWSSASDGLIEGSKGEKIDVLMVEASIPDLLQPDVLVFQYRRRPFRLVGAFNFQNHPQLRLSPFNATEYMTSFRRGMASHPFGARCKRYVEEADKS